MRDALGRWLAGTPLLVRVALRRDRVQLTVWVVGLAGFMAGAANVMSGLFDSPRELEQAVSILAANPVMRAFGLASGATVGGLLMLRALGFIGILAALMSAMIVVRHTRQNEETRRAELIGSAVVGRHAGLGAALIVAVIANLALLVLTAGGLMLNGLPTAGALAAGSALAAMGIAFAGVAAIAAQVAENSRSATGLAATAIGAAFLLSATGNVMGRAEPSGLMVHSAWPAWLSPIGWAQQVRPFGGDHWWVLGLFIAWFVAAVTVAVMLERRRDVGRGMIPERRGPARAAASLLSPLGLAWRLHRGVIVGWAVGVTIFGAVFGAVSDAFDDLIADVEGAAELFARIGGTEQLTEGFFATILGLMALVVAAYTIPALLRMRSEEVEGLLEPLLATGVRRERWMLSHLGVVLPATLVLLLLTGVSAGLLSGLAMGDLAGQTASLTAAALVQAPAVLLLGGIAVAVYGFAPRFASPVAWAGFTVALVGGPMVGGLLDLPQWAMNASPFTHVPGIPAEDFAATPVVALLAVAAVLYTIGFFAFRPRDLALGAGEAAPALRLLRRRTGDEQAEVEAEPVQSA